ncbi:MAG: nitroreductase family protein [Actinomycetota bacterium]|nr:nitroreductase family protein [Actinomycetota bacterium]
MTTGRVLHPPTPTVSGGDANVTKALRRAAVRATRAPSIHNTQPWRLSLTSDSLELHADRSRQLRVLDPRCRQLLISCGCALFNARSALARAGYHALVERFPDPKLPDLVARIGVAEAGHPVDAAVAALDDSIHERRTNRREFVDEEVPDEIVRAIVSAARIEGAQAMAIVRPQDRVTIARLSQLADELELTDPAYRAELRAWTSDDPRCVDGVPAFAVPHVDAGAGDEVPIRDFDTRGMGWLPTRTRSSRNQTLLLVGALADSRDAWLRTGEALERMWLEITRRGYAASPLTQMIEVARTNAELRRDVQLAMHPHVLLRIGLAPGTPETRRRRLVDVLTDDG